MDTPLHPVRRTGRWLRRVAVVALLGGSVVGCLDANNFTGNDTPLPGQVVSQLPPDKTHPPDPAVVQAKSDSPWFEWPDVEWSDFDLFGLLPKTGPDIPPSDAIELQGDKLTPVKAPSLAVLEGKMALAKECFDNKDYARAEKIFHRIGDNQKNPPKLVQKALFFEAECLYNQDLWNHSWPKAADTYMELLNKFPRNEYRDKALLRLFEIANFWLNDTREEMNEYKEKDEGKRSIVVPRFVSFDNKKPFLDREGRAIQLLEAVHFGDINSPLGDQAYYLCGSVKFFDEDYKDADSYFTQLTEKHKNHHGMNQNQIDMVENAMKLAIIAKHLSTGGADYDGRKVAEARVLVQQALVDYPELNKNDFLKKQLIDIAQQQAEKDFKMAEFYEHMGHPGSAVFYYELVIRRYSGAQPFAALAAQRRDDILKKMEQEKLVEPPPHSQSPPLEQAPAPRQLPADLGPGR